MRRKRLSQEWVRSTTQRRARAPAYCFAWILTAGAQMQGEVELFGQGAWFAIVIAVVEAQMLLASPGWLWPFNGDGIKGLAHQLVVVAVGAVDGHRERHPAAVGQLRALHPAFSSVCRIRAGLFPTKRGLGHRPVQSQPTPVDSNRATVRQQPLPPECREHPGGHPLLKASMRRGRRADAGLVQCVPPTTCPQHEENRVHRRAVWDPRIVTAQWMFRPRW